MGCFISQFFVDDNSLHNCSDTPQYFKSRTILTFGQTNNNGKRIELGKTYKDFMFRNEPTKEVFKDIKADVSENIKSIADFIVQTITTKNKLQTVF